MEAGVFLLQGDNTLVRMVEQPYEAESLLQRLLVEHPELLAGDQINPSTPRRWLLIQREAGVPAEEDGGNWWAVDHLFLDQDSIPTFVEVKRATDTRVRREVVAQMLDYAANATAYWPVDKMREEFGRRCAEVGTDPAVELREVIGSDSDETVFWDLAKSNLRDGRVRLLFVADRIPPSLRRIVEFLNQQMSPAEVLAVEIRQFGATNGDQVRTLVPQVIGQSQREIEAKKTTRTTVRPVAITHGEFFALYGSELRDLALAIHKIAQEAGYVFEYLRSDVKPWARITLEDVPGTPVTMDDYWLWVSLGRHHPALRSPDVNSQLRKSVLQVCPTCKRAEDPKKSEVGIPLKEIGPVGLQNLPRLFDQMKLSLERE